MVFPEITRLTIEILSILFCKIGCHEWSVPVSISPNFNEKIKSTGFYLVGKPLNHQIIILLNKFCRRCGTIIQVYREGFVGTVIISEWKQWSKEELINIENLPDYTPVLFPEWFSYAILKDFPVLIYKELKKGPPENLDL